MFTISAEQIETASTEKIECYDWGYKVWLKNESGEWYVDHVLVTDERTRTSTKVYTDNRPSEIIKWGHTI